MAPEKKKRPVGAPRPFPWRCRHCGKNEVILARTEYHAEVRHDGRLHIFTVPELELPICQSCGTKVFTADADEQICAALRAHLTLLTPLQMSEAIQRINLTQKEVAARLGIAEATLSRWLNGIQIQTRSMDNLLRAFFAFPQVRNAFSGTSQDPKLGTSDIEQNREPTTHPPATTAIRAFRQIY